MQAENSCKNEQLFVLAALVEDEDEEYENGLVETEMKENPPLVLVRGFQSNHPDELQPKFCIALSILFQKKKKIEIKTKTCNKRENDYGFGNGIGFIFYINNNMRVVESGVRVLYTGFLYECLLLLVRSFSKFG